MLFTEINVHNGVYVLDVFSGQFSNSISLLFYPLFLGLLWRMHQRNEFSVFPAITFALMTLAHAMFTPIAAALHTPYLVITSPHRNRTTAFLIATFGLAFLLIAFWALPFFGDTNFSHAVGTRLSITLQYFIKLIDIPTGIILALGVLGVILSLIRSEEPSRFFAFGGIVIACLTLISLVSNSLLTLAFFNRFFPLVYFHACVLAAYAITESARSIFPRSTGWIVPIVLGGIVALTLTSTIDTVPQWARWNYEGIEAKVGVAQWMELNRVIADLPANGRVGMEMLRDTRWATALGGPFVLEITPMYTGKPTVSTGSHALYSLSFRMIEQYILAHAATLDADRFERQSRMLGIGYLVKTDRVNAVNLNKYYELVAISPAGAGEVFQIYRSRTPVRFVDVPRYSPVRVLPPYTSTDTLVKWLSNNDINEVPLVLSPSSIVQTITQGSYIPKHPVNRTCDVVERIERTRIEFSTSCVGEPHIIKVSYHPGWKAIQGANEVSQVTPNFLLVYPTQSDVVIVFGPSLYGTIGNILTGLGILLCAVLLAMRAGLISSGHVLKLTPRRRPHSARRT